jgi:hypothetical protein
MAVLAAEVMPHPGGQSTSGPTDPIELLRIGPEFDSSGGHGLSFSPSQALDLSLVVSALEFHRDQIAYCNPGCTSLCPDFSSIENLLVLPLHKNT